MTTKIYVSVDPWDEWIVIGVIRCGLPMIGKYWSSYYLPLDIRKTKVISFLILVFKTAAILNGSHGNLDTILKKGQPKDHPSQIWFNFWLCSFKGEDLNVIFYQNIRNLHTQYKSGERKISQKNPEYMLNCTLPCSCS